MSKPYPKKQSTHFEVIKELLKVAQTTNNREETKRLTTYIDKMHSRCIDKRIESCTSPCTLQKTKRGDFCIYNPGNIEDEWPSLIRVENIRELSDFPPELVQMVYIDATTNICDANILAITSKGGKDHIQVRLKNVLKLIEPPFRIPKELICKLQILILKSKRIGSANMTIFATALASGALAQLTHLNLDKNEIGDDGMHSLSDALSKGALANLKELELYSNKIGDKGLEAFAGALSKGALSNLVNLSLYKNSIGDEGMKAFVSALESGALPNLETLWLSGNRISDEGMQAFSTAAGILPNLMKLFMDDNQISDKGMAVFSTALASGAFPKLKFCNVVGNPASNEAIEAVYKYC